ncbi:MAG TPA: ferredoxin [Baekduia sp.]
MTYVITEACIDQRDRSCIEVCPVDCIYEGTRMLYVNAEECIDCAACEPACPVDAIFYEEDLPEPLTGYAAINAAAFVATREPGDHDVADPPEVAAHPAAQRAGDDG